MLLSSAAAEDPSRVVSVLGPAQSESSDTCGLFLNMMNESIASLPAKWLNYAQKQSKGRHTRAMCPSS